MQSKYMKVLYIFCVFMLAFALTIIPKDIAFAASCSGTGCNGTLASSTGCGVNVSTKATSYPASSRLELRRSSDCSTFWTKTTNTDSLGRNLWGVATLRPYNSYTLYTGGAVAVGQAVVSYQRYSTASGTAGFNACGYYSLNQITSPAPYTASCAPYP